MKQEEDIKEEADVKPGPIKEEAEVAEVKKEPVIKEEDNTVVKDEPASPPKTRGGRRGKSKQ